MCGITIFLSWEVIYDKESYRSQLLFWQGGNAMLPLCYSLEKSMPMTVGCSCSRNTLSNTKNSLCIDLQNELMESNRPFNIFKANLFCLYFTVLCTQ